VLTQAYQVYRVNRGSTVTVSGQTHESAVPAHGYGALNQDTSIDSLAPALAGQGWSKPISVEVPGIEPGSFVASSGLLRAQSATPLLGSTGHADQPV
jgi:hypothetical protein